MKHMALGRVVREVEAKANEGATRLELSLKEDGGDFFVVLAMKSAGNYQYAHFDRAEFERFAACTASLQEDMATR